MCQPKRKFDLMIKNDQISILVFETLFHVCYSKVSRQRKGENIMKKISFVMLFLLVVMAGCSNYDTYIETGMQSLKDEKYSDATMWFEKAEKRNQEMKRNHIKKLPR